MNEQTEVPSLIDDLISEKDAAKLLGHSHQWLRDLRRDGKGPMYVELGNKVSYYRADVREWLLAQRKASKKVDRKPRAAKKVAPKAAPSKKATQE